MDRKIKFRGKGSNTGKWKYGYYVVRYGHLGEEIHVITDGSEDFEVEPETVGQFTGMKDKNGTEIYEGDFLDRKYKWFVDYKNDGFIAKATVRPEINTNTLHNIIRNRVRAGIGIEVTGNIHDNPDQWR